MSDELVLRSTHSLNASVNLPGSDMLGGWYTNAAPPSELFVPVYATRFSEGITDYRCIAVVNTTAVSYAATLYFSAPSALTATARTNTGDWSPV